MRSKLPLSILIVLTSVLPLQGQEDASFAGFQFNRSLPGARSLGMGGAFVALADDATAAYANPAGLTRLESPELSLEGRIWNLSTPYTARGDATLQSSFSPGEFAFEESQSTSSAPSFASFVYTRPGTRWAAAVYRHQLMEYHTRFSSFGVLKDEEEFFGPLDFSTDLEIANYGLSGAVRLNDRLSLGAGVSYYDFRLHSRQFIRKPTFTQEAGKEGDDSAVDFNVGILWQIDPAWTAGASYRRGPKFEMNECFPSVRTPCFDGVHEGILGGGSDVISDFRVPDQLAVGIAFQPTDRLTFLLEADRIEYSALLEGNRLGGFSVDGKSYSFQLEDATEIRLGMEILIPRPRGESVAVMLGSWYDPDHTISFTDAGGGPSLRFRRAYFQPTGDDEIHLSAGLEVKLGNYQVNLGFDHSERIDTLALSTVVWKK
jgi:long-chain fatty acid transport protein